MLSRVTRYLSFLEHARCPVRGFHNFLSYQRDWLDAEGTGDCQGQAVVALAEVLGSTLPDGYRLVARELIEAVLPALADLRSLRAQAYVILAWGHLWGQGIKDIEPIESVAWSAARRLVECYNRSMRPDWPWFESRMTYANAVLPHALFVAARHWPGERLSRRGRILVCLSRQRRRRPRASSGPSETTTGIRVEKTRRSTISSPWRQPRWPTPHSQALDLLGDEKYRSTFRRAHAWFHGENSLRQPLVDATQRRLLRRLAGDGRESQPGSRIDAGVSVDRIAQCGNLQCGNVSPHCRRTI